MARLPAVLDALEMIGGHDRKTWDVFARKLREAGELAPTKRGAGATSLDAGQVAKILLAGMATDSPARGPDMISRYWTAPLDDDGDEVPAIAPCVRQTLGETLSVLLHDGEEIIRSSWQMEHTLYNKKIAARLKRDSKTLPLSTLITDFNYMRSAISFEISRTEGLANLSSYLLYGGELAERDKVEAVLAPLGQSTWDAATDEQASQPMPGIVSIVRIETHAIVLLSETIRGTEPKALG